MVGESADITLALYMDFSTKIVVGFIVAVVLFGIGRFTYVNIIVPLPYRDDLRACLKEARALDSKESSEEAENTCLRMYPHFN